MRADLVSPSSAHLSYAIRDIVKFGELVRQHGADVTWENIGDPVAKGETIEPWIRQIFHEVVDRDIAWGYCPTEGFLEAREALAAHVNARPGARITASDIIFFNGVADAVAKVYGFLSPHARVIGPSPAYSTHSSAESAHCALPHITYDLDPDNGWLPDLDDLRQKIQKFPSIAGILIINPNNPTGAVYPVEVLEKIVALAREFGLFIIADEIYIHMVFPGVETAHLSEVNPDVPAIVMRGVSKELPWPGSRCGWIEVLNRSRDQNFSAYVDSLMAAKRLEVCSTSGPQLVVRHASGASCSDVRGACRGSSPGAEWHTRHQAAQGAGRFLRDGDVPAGRAERQEHTTHRGPGSARTGRKSVQRGRPRLVLRLSSARVQGHLRGPAHGVLLATSGLPLYSARDR
jgi:alanine-synthesizing transaminase